MPFNAISSPHIVRQTSVARVMQQVIIALIPGTLATAWYFGWGVLFNVVIAVAVALASESAMLWARRRPLQPFISDYSAVVAAWILALALPPLAPWWLTAMGSAFAIVVVKHLYGGLGYNVFNPAMAGYVVLIVSFPAQMTLWPPPSMLAEIRFGPIETALIMLSGDLPRGMTWDVITMATPLDTMRTELDQNLMIEEIRASPLWGDFGGRGWEWVGNWFLLGGLWLLYKRIIGWQIPVGMLGGLLAVSTLFYLIDADRYPFPAFHVFSGGAMLGAFFVATDPVSASATPRGRIIYGAGIGVLTFVIRSWGGYPDGVAFSILLMNMAVPTIDYYTRPRVYGHGLGRD